jgi:hypothetical protein
VLFQSRTAGRLRRPAHWAGPEKLPVISIVTNSINKPVLILAAIDMGIKLFTTSSYYGEGNNEIMLNGVIRSRPGESFLIATSSRPEGMDRQNGIFTDPNAETNTFQI